MTVRLPEPIRGAHGAAALALLLTASCATPPPPPAPTIAYEQKVSWILWLEDQRILRDPAPAPPPAAPVNPRGRQVATPVPPAEPDLVKLAADADPRIRRRAALAIGRVGLGEGLPALRTLIADTDPDVRQAAAFAAGVLGDVAAAEMLVAAVGADADLRVRAHAAEALGLLADRHPKFDGTAAIAAIGPLVSSHAAAAAAVAPDELGSPLAPELEAFRRGLYALVRLKAYEPVARAVLDEKGLPRVRWWPAAFALQRLEDPSAVPALLALLRGEGAYAAAFAARGLGALRDASAVEPLIAAATKDARPAVRLRAVESLGRLGDARAAAPLLALLDQQGLPPAVRLAAIAALGHVKAAPAFEPLLDLLSDRSPLVRAATQRALAAIDPVGFVNVLSGMDLDQDWTVRAALAETLASLPGNVPHQRLLAALGDSDQRAVPAVLRALVRANVPGADRTLLEKMKSDQAAVREAAVRLLAQVKSPAAVPALVAAYEAAASDPTSDMREAILSALVELEAPEARAVATRALSDADWALRLRAQRALKEIDPAAAAEPTRPAAVRLDRATYDALAAPAVSPHVFIETSRGNIEIELAVVDAPLTSHNFMTLARKGYFNAARIHRVVPDFVMQDGDPRGDGSGGPGYSIRDELNDLPYLRGTVGMALSGPDSGGSQFFITHSPQPHLDGKYTVFGKVVSGMEVVDQLQQGDTIDRVRVWDGVAMTRLRGSRER